MNSMLNPEAPEFYPHILNITQEAYTTVTKSVTTSNSFPKPPSYDLFKTFAEFNTLTTQLSESVTNLSNEIMSNEFPSVKLREDDSEYNEERIVDYNDRVLDRVEMHMDTLSEGTTVGNQVEDNMMPSTSASTSNNNQMIVSTIQVGSSLLIGAKNVPRPQLTFKDSVDNSESLWVPIIKDKPNNIKPLALKIQYNGKGVAVGYEHPYQVEIDAYEPPEMFMVPDKEPPSYPLPMDQTKYTYIDTESQVDQLVEHLNTVQEFAVDVEHHSYRTYQGITCLIQISTDEGGDFIIDTLAVREHIHKLNVSFTDPRKLKVFHGADMDVKWLQRDFGVYIVGLFDTYRAAKTLLMNGLSLKHLLMKYCELNADKKYQLADWRMRPLPDELIEYARQDTHYLLYVWRRMKAELLGVSNGSNQLLRSVFKNSKFVCSMTYNKLVVDESSHLAMYVRSKRTFDVRQMAALKMLYKWRDAQARLLDESTSYLLPNHMLLSLAGTLPRDVEGVHACCSPMPPFVKQNIITIHKMVLSCRQISLESDARPMPSGSAPCFPRRRTRVPCNVHDLSTAPKPMKDVEMMDMSMDETDESKPSLSALVPDEDTKMDCETHLKVEQDIPPYYRYQGYRLIAKGEEDKKNENNEAKVTAIAQGDQFIKSELLEKPKASKPALEVIQTSEIMYLKRKRKTTMDYVEGAEDSDDDSDSSGGGFHGRYFENKIDGSGPSTSKAKTEAETEDVKSFNYENANYKDLYNDREKMRKQGKMKFTKRN